MHFKFSALTVQHRHKLQMSCGYSTTCERPDPSDHLRGAHSVFPRSKQREVKQLLVEYALHLRNKLPEYHMFAKTVCSFKSDFEALLSTVFYRL